MRANALLLLLILNAASFPVVADIYRWVDADGNVVYGDNPPQKKVAKPVDLPTLTVADSFVPAPAAGPPAAPAEEPASTQYARFKITSPQADEAIRANDGTVTVDVQLEPALRKGDNVVLYLDAKQAASGAQSSFQLTEVERGEHAVFAVVNDAAGNIIQNTDPVKFNVLRYSALLAPPKN